MARLAQIARSLRQQPGYTLMRGVARFGFVREVVGSAHRLVHRQQIAEHLAACERRMEGSFFHGVDCAGMVNELRQEGLALGLTLPTETVTELRAYASAEPCYADRDPALGFHAEDHAAAQARIGKPLLLGQYFNVVETCPSVRALADDPALQWIAGRYLDSMPTFVGANLWWTFPVNATEQDRDRHAHRFHRDVDDFRFLKFFFYLTDVRQGDGPHVCVRASHRSPPMLRLGDRWNLRRYSDDEVHRSYPAAAITEICGSAGQGFAENTLCVHKGRTPTMRPRLLLQLQYALFDHGNMHDRRPADVLRKLI
jgi:hypothetical protein